MTPPRSQFGPCRRARGTVWPSRTSEPGLAGQKSEVITAPFHTQRDGPFLCDYERFLSRFLRRVRVEIRP
jgi:hypothetical protein